MSVVHQKNKKTGVTYVYESVSYWDKKKQQSRARRKCIGRIDPRTNEIVPTKPRLKKKETKKSPGPIPVIQASRTYYGATYLFDKIGKKIDVVSDLKSCFPESYKQILSIAYYLILEDKNPLSRFPKWAKMHKHPYEKVISSQRSSDLFASITEDSRSRFFRMQGDRRIENEYWFYDTTSISSYSQVLQQVRYGVNKDHDPLPQINLALLFGQTSQLPFYYRKLPGNISDVKTVKKLLNDMSFLDFKRVKLVMDRGFYSADNINELYKHHLKFLMATKTSLKMVKKEIDLVRDEMLSWKNYHAEYDLYTQTIPIEWDYKQCRPYKKEILREKRRMYLHLYYSGELAIEHARSFNRKLQKLQSELEENKRDPKHEVAYTKYFETKTTPARGITVRAKEDVIKEIRKNYGYFALISNGVKNADEAIRVYKSKDLVEKAFGNLKERLNFRRAAVSSELSLDGKLFVEFIALIFLSYIKKQMQNANLFKKYTLREILDELDIIECFEQPERKLHVGEITKKQSEIFSQLGVSPPVSLQ